MKFTLGREGRQANDKELNEYGGQHEKERNVRSKTVYLLDNKILTIPRRYWSKIRQSAVPNS